MSNQLDYQSPLTTDDQPGLETGFQSYRWVVCALLFFATTINYVDRQILALIQEVLEKEIGLDAATYGFVQAAFQFSYGLGLLGFGWFVDKFGVKIGYAISIVAWSLASLSHAIVFNVGGFIGARVALGLGESGNFPSAIKATAQWFPKRERAFATSIFNSGTNVGAIVAPAFVPVVAFNLGWRWTFVFTAAACAIWLLFWMKFFNVPTKTKGITKKELAHINSDLDEQAIEQQAGANAQKSVSWGKLLRHRQTWSFVVAKFMTDPVWWFFLTWLPMTFRETWGLDIRKSWAHLVTIYSIVTVLGIAGGWVTGYLKTRGWTITRARKTGMFLFALLVVPVFAVGSIGAWPAVLVIGLAGAAHQSWSANLFTTVSDMFPKRAVASVIGLGGMAGAFGGVIVQPLTGLFVSHFKSIGQGPLAYGIIFGIISSTYVVTFIIHHLIAPKFDQISLD